MRRRFMRRKDVRYVALLVLVALGVAFSAVFLREAQAPVAPTAASTARPQTAPQLVERRIYLTREEIARIKANIKRYSWARIAWENTKKEADAALAESPEPADPEADYGPRAPDPCRAS